MAYFFFLDKAFVYFLIFPFFDYIFHRLRRGGPKKFTPEVVTLHNAKHRIRGHHVQGRYMKEKLIVAGEGLQEVEAEPGIVGISDLENPDSDSLRYSFTNSINGDYSDINPLEGNSVQRLSGVSGLSNLSGFTTTSSGNGSISGSLKRMLMYDTTNPNDYGAIGYQESGSHEDPKNEGLNISEIQVEVK